LYGLLRDYFKLVSGIALNYVWRFVSAQISEHIPPVFVSLGTKKYFPREGKKYWSVPSGHRLLQIGVKVKPLRIRIVAKPVLGEKKYKNIVGMRKK